MLHLLFIFAASAQPFDLQAHLTAVCAVDAPVVAVDEALAEIDLPPRRGTLAVHVRVSPTGVQLDGMHVQPEAMADKLADKRARAEEIASRIGDDSFKGNVLVAITRDATAARVVPVLDALAASGFTQAWFVANSSQPLALPELPSARLAKQVIGKDGSVIPRSYNEAWQSERKTCPPLDEALAEVRKTPPGHKCETMVQLVPPAVGSCKKTDPRRIGTFLQLSLLPTDERVTTGWEVTLDPTAEVIRVAPTTLWPDLIPLLLEYEDQPVRLERE